MSERHRTITRAARAVAAAAALAVAAASPAQAPESVAFPGMPAPATAEQIASAYSAARARLRYADGTERVVPLTYRTVFRNVDRVGSNPHPAGQIYDAAGRALSDPGGRPLVSETPDGTTLLAVPGAGRTDRGERRLFLVTQFEYDWLLGDGTLAWMAPGWYSRMPMTMALTTVGQDPDSGVLRAVDQRNVDFSGVGGLWIPCAASRTPWNTHLGAEEDYDLFRRGKADRALRGMSALYLGGRPANPFDYGYIVEVAVDAGGATRVAKHRSMGRAAWEKAVVMPDRRTAYMGDDGAYTGLFMYVADRAGDLSEGTLYAGRWKQRGHSGGGRADLAWIRLGHAGDAEVAAMAAAERFSGGRSSIFEFAPAAASGFRTVRAGEKKTDEHLRLRPGKARAAAFLDSRRYAAYLGATTEFNKMEGVAVDARGRTVYVAMSRVARGMTAADGGPVDHVRLPRVAAGAVYAMRLSAGVADAGGRAIDSDWVAVDMASVPELLGRDLDTPDDLGNRADPERVANPDNLAFSPGMRTLFVGEDSGAHVNNFVWAFNVDTRALARILSVPAGAEATGLQVVDDIGGHAYVLGNYQHAGERVEVRDADLRAAVRARLDPFVAAVGYLHGLPAF